VQPSKSSSHPPQDAVPTKLRIRWSDIVIKRPIADGGFGEVYGGSWQGHKVAVKQLKPERLSPAARAAFNREAAVMCELRHPSIAIGYGE
jgi:serine/threonine protein kinase